ncbi:MAG TPA: methionyl-tRNA formyltransferase [Thermodesulfobacteriota bacterium]|nr:methionyl-tRNA formyltransferase [Thermodesulfobacteriota bacterium]
MGTPEFSVPSLRALLSAGKNIVLVVTQPEKPKGRGQKLSAGCVKEFALKNNLIVSEPRSLKDEGWINELRSLSLDLIVVVAYGKILPEEVLGIPRFGCVNLHASLLPSYRGASPVNWAIINGDKETGVTAIVMDKGVDTGPILLSEKAGIKEDETAGELSRKLSEVGAALLVKAIELFLEGRIKPAPQDDRNATCAPLLKKEDGKIDWNLGAERIKNLVRGLSPWPGAYTFLRGKLLKIHSAEAQGDSGDSVDLKPGTVFEAEKGRIRVKCGSGVLEIKELQIEGKRRLSAREFLRGYGLGKEVFV